MQGKYKLIVGISEGVGLFQHKEFFKPLYFDTLKELQAEFSNIKKEVDLFQQSLNLIRKINRLFPNLLC